MTYEILRKTGRRFLNKKGMLVKPKKVNEQKEFQEFTDQLYKNTAFLPNECSLFYRWHIVEFNITSETFRCLVDDCNQPRKFSGRTKKNPFAYTCGKKDKKHRVFLSNVKINKLNETLFKKYGVKNSMHLEDTKKKMRLNNIKKYGVEYPMQLETFKEKLRKTCLQKYGVEYYTQTEEMKIKTERTFYRKYKAKWISQTDFFKEKVQKTNLQKYGVRYPMQSEKIKKKSKETCIKKYGVEYPTQIPSMKYKAKQTFLCHYDVENPSQAEEIKEKKKQTCVFKYSVPHYTKSRTFYCKYHPNINYERWSSLTKEFIKENFIDENDHLMVQELMNYVGWSSTDPVYKKCRELGVKWTHDLGGFDPTKPATLYYIYDPQENMYKIGITNHDVQTRFGKDFCSKRAGRDDLSGGLIILVQWDYEIGEHAYLAEQEVLKAFRDYRCTNPSWPEELGGKTEFFKTDILQKKE